MSGSSSNLKEAKLEGGQHLKAVKTFCFDYSNATLRRSPVSATASSISPNWGCRSSRPRSLMTASARKGRLHDRARHLGLCQRFLRYLRLGGPVIAIHTEYDANPDNSQASGVAEHATRSSRARRAIAKATTSTPPCWSQRARRQGRAGKFGLKGTLKVFGAPAEEQLISRPYFVRDGWFDDVDVAFADHIGPGISGRLRPDPVGADLGDVHVPRRDRPCRRCAVEGARRARRRRADGHGARAVPRAHDAEHASAARHHQRRQPAQRDPAHRRRMVVLPRLSAEGVRKLFEQAKKIAAGRGDDDQHDRRGPRSSARCGRCAATVRSPNCSSAKSNGRPAGLDQGGGRSRPRRAGEGERAGRGPRAHQSTAQRSRRAKGRGKRRR